MKVNPTPHAIFETTMSGLIQIWHLCSVLWKITPLYLLAQISFTLDKNSPLKWNFGSFGWLGENSQNSSCHIWNYKSVFFYKLHVSLQCHERSLFCTFLAEILYYFDERSPSKYQISDFQFHQIFTLMGPFCWKNIKFQLQKYRGVVSYDTDDWSKAWRKTDLLFQDWKDFREFWYEQSKV